MTMPSKLTIKQCNRLIYVSPFSVSLFFLFFFDLAYSNTPFRTFIRTSYRFTLKRDRATRHDRYLAKSQIYSCRNIPRGV